MPSDSDSPRLPAHCPPPEASLPLNSPGITCYGVGRQDQAPHNVSGVPAGPRLRHGANRPAPQKVELPPVLSYFQQPLRRAYDERAPAVTWPGRDGFAPRRGRRASHTVSTRHRPPAREHVVDSSLGQFSARSLTWRRHSLVCPSDSSEQPWWCRGGQAAATVTAQREGGDIQPRRLASGTMVGSVL